MAMLGWTWVVSTLSPRAVFSASSHICFYVWFCSFMAHSWPWGCQSLLSLVIWSPFFWYPWGPHQLPHVFLPFCSISPPWESLGLFYAFWTRVHIMGKDCLYSVLKLRSWEKEMGEGGESENWELERKWQSFGFSHSCVWTSSCWLCI